MSVLQRKARAGKQEHQARSMTVPKALRVGLAKVGNDLFDLALAVIGATQDSCPGDEIADRLEEGGLLLLLDGPSGATAGAILEGGLVGAMVQQQTTGRVKESQISDRILTATDAALCAPLIDAIFKRANGLLESEDDKDLLSVFKFGARCDNRRLFALALDAQDYHIIKLTVDVAGGVLQSTVTLILPIPEKRPEIAPDNANPEQGVQINALGATVMGLKAEITAVLCGIKMPISQVSALQQGQVFPVPADAFDNVVLYANGGRKLAVGGMGQVDGRRAIMLDSQLDGAGGKADDTETPATSFPVEDGAGIDLPDLPSIPDIPNELPQQAQEAPLDLPELPDIPDFDDPEGTEELVDLAPMADLPDLPDIPDFDEELPDIGELPKLNIA